MRLSLSLSVLNCTVSFHFLTFFQTGKLLLALKKWECVSKSKGIKVKSRTQCIRDFTEPWKRGKMIIFGIKFLENLLLRSRPALITIFVFANQSIWTSIFQISINIIIGSRLRPFFGTNTHQTIETQTHTHTAGITKISSNYFNVFDAFCFST